MLPRRALLWTAALALVASCAADPAPATQPDVERWRVTVIATLDHDPSAFTQGLEVEGDDLYESTGRNGSSYVRRSSRQTGQVKARADLPEQYFGEGIAVTENTLWQLTWRNGVAFARDRDTLAQERTVSYDGEGWGLCADAAHGLVMSDGSDTLTFRDPTTFTETGSVSVTAGGTPLAELNELECADDGSVYANVWQTYDIARIDPESGTVTAMIDAEPLFDSMTRQERDGVDVLNGIAQIPGTDRFLVTGKLWPKMYDVEFTPTS